MSAGAFVRTRYELDNGDISPIRVQPETLGLTLSGSTNDAPAGAVDRVGSVNVSRGARSNGVNARMVRVTFTGAPPAGYLANSVIALPWLSQSTFDGLASGDAGTYLGAAIELVGKTPERVR